MTLRKRTLGRREEVAQNLGERGGLRASAESHAPDSNGLSGPAWTRNTFLGRLEPLDLKASTPISKIYTLLAKECHVIQNWRD